jgi:hypothetical protein
MHNRSKWTWAFAVTALVIGASYAQAKDVVLQDGGVVVASNENTGTVTDTQQVPPIGPIDETTGNTGTQDSPEPATLTLLGLGGLGALWKIRRRKNVAV